MATPTAEYWVAVVVLALLGAGACAYARRSPRLGGLLVGRTISIMLAADAIVFAVQPMINGHWTFRRSVPLDLCDLALVLACVTCWRPRWQLGVELTYFWGLAGTLEAIVTPDLSQSFPSLEFFQFVVGHVGIVIAALFLVVGLRRVPRRGSVTRVFAITVGYTALVAVVDLVTDSNYMYLARIPGRTSLLSVLGPWPWYIVTAAGVALVSFVLLDLPFRHRRGRPRPEASEPSNRP